MPAIFAFAFRQDGFGMVLSQALGSGLSVVRTERTGGPDLAGLPGLARLIRVVPTGDALALRRALTQALGNAMEKIGVASITEAEWQVLSWGPYALRDPLFMSDLVKFTNLIIKTVGLWRRLVAIQTRGRGYKASDGDGIFIAFAFLIAWTW